MATSNRDRIGKTFELLAPALDDFIGRSVAGELPDDASWTALVAMKDKKKGIEGKEYHPLDPQVQLRMLTENIPHNLKPGWYPFDDAIGRVGQGYSKELREARNDWAHNKSFSDDDAYRCLDTAERLLVAIGAPAVADEVKAIRLGLRRLTADKDDRKTLKSAAATPESAGLRPWREVLAPHKDRRGTSKPPSSPPTCTRLPRPRRRARTTPSRSSSSRAPTSPKACATSSTARCGASRVTRTPHR